MLIFFNLSKINFSSSTFVSVIFWSKYNALSFNAISFKFLEIFSIALSLSIFSNSFFDRVDSVDSTELVEATTG